MTVYFDKARRRWRFDFEASGKRYSGYCVDAGGSAVTSKSAARQAEGVEKRKVELAPKMARAGEIALAQLIADLKPVWKTQAHWTNTQRYIREILAWFGPETAVREINSGRIDDYIRHMMTEPTRQWRGGPKRDPNDPAHARFWVAAGKPRGPATINLYLGILRQCLDRATKIRDPLTGEPALAHAPRVPELAVPKRRARPIPDTILGDILAMVPAHVANAILLTLYFGFRRGEVFSLQKHHIDIDAGGVRLYLENVKDKEDTFLPGAPAAMTLLAQLSAEADDRKQTHLITWRRHEKDAWQPIKRPKAAWARAMKEMEKRYGRRYRWHDVRAAFITHVALTSGAIVAQALARHSDYKTTQSYVEVADEFRRTAATRAADRPALKLVRNGK